MGTMKRRAAAVHAVWIGTHWPWYLPAGNIPAFEAGKCPT